MSLSKTVGGVAPVCLTNFLAIRLPSMNCYNKASMRRLPHCGFASIPQPRMLADVNHCVNGPVFGNME